MVFSLDISTIIDIIAIMTTELDTFLKVCADETRREIMRHLCCAWLSVNDVVDHLGGKVNQPTVSHHLKKLEEANLVDVRQEGRQRFYTLNRDQFTICCGMFVQFVDPYRVAQFIPIDQIK